MWANASDYKPSNPHNIVSLVSSKSAKNWPIAPSQDPLQDPWNARTIRKSRSHSANK